MIKETTDNIADPDVKKVMERYWASRNGRGSRETQWNANYQRYLSKNDDSEDKYFIPETYTTVRTMLPRLVGPFLNRAKPIISVEARNPENQAKAKKQEALLGAQMAADNFDVKLPDWYQLALIYDCGFVKTFWDYREKEEEEQQPVFDIEPETGMQYQSGWNAVPVTKVERDDPSMEVISPYDLFVGPAEESINGVNPARFVIYKKNLSREEIENLADAGMYDAGKVEKLFEEVPEGTGREDSAKQTDMDLHQYKTLEQQAGIEGKYEVLEYWDGKNVIEVAEERFILRKDENKHGYLPFVSMTYSKLPFQLYGMGVPEVIEDLQDIMNEIANMRLDNVKKNVNPMFFVRKGVLNEKEIKFRPMGLIPVKGSDLDKKILMRWEVPDVTASSYNEQQVAQQGIQNATAVSDYVRGVDSDVSPKKTATEVMQKSQQSGTTFEFIFKQMALSILDVARQFLAMTKKYLNEPKQVKVMGRRGITEYMTITPEDLEGEYDIILTIDPLRANEQSRRESVLQFYQMTMGNPLMLQNINPRRLIEKVIEVLELDPEILKSEEEIMNEQREAQAQQGAGLIQMPGGGGVPPGGDAGAAGMPGMEGISPAPPPGYGQ